MRKDCIMETICGTGLLIGYFLHQKKSQRKKANQQKTPAAFFFFLELEISLAVAGWLAERQRKK